MEPGGSSPAGAAGEVSNEGGAASGGRGGSSGGGTSSSGAPSATGGATPSGDEGGSAGTSVNGDGGTPSIADAGEGGVASASMDGGSGGEAGTMTSGGAQSSGGAPSTGGAAPSSGGSAPTGGAGGSGDATFSDDFEDGNAAGWEATSWMVYSDGSNQVLRQNPDYAGQTVPAKAASSITGNRWMEVRFKFTQISGVSFAVLGADFETADTRDQIMIDNTGAGTLLSSRAGTPTTDTFTATIVANTWYRMALEIDGTTLRGYLGGELVAELTNVTGVQGGIALTANQNGDLLYDDVSVCAGSAC